MHKLLVATMSHNRAAPKDTARTKLAYMNIRRGAHTHAHMHTHTYTHTHTHTYTNAGRQAGQSCAYIHVYITRNHIYPHTHILRNSRNASNPFVDRPYIN